MNNIFHPGDIVQHFKRETLDPEAFAQNKYLYRIVGVATHSETGEPMMVYQPLYDEKGMYVRPLEMFLSEVDHEKYPGIKQKYRFEKVTESSGEIENNTSEKEELYRRIKAFLKDNPGVRAKEVAASIGVTKKEVNHILYSNDYKAVFIQNENYEWFITPGIMDPIELKGGIYYLTNIGGLPEITIYKDSVDFANKLEYVNTAMLSMKSPNYVLIELQRHKETSDFYIEIHKWRSYQKEHDGLICHVAYYDQEEGIRKRDFTDYLSEYSALRLLGYHVGNGVAESTRRRILMNCVYFDLIGLQQVISHIDYLIKHGDKTQNAKEQWGKDLVFIKDYENNKLSPTWKHLRVRRAKWKHESDELEKQFIKEFFKK